MTTEAFDELFQKHINEIYRHCCRIVRNREDAEELASEAFVRAFVNLAQFEAGEYTPAQREHIAQCAYCTRMNRLFVKHMALCNNVL